MQGVACPEDIATALGVGTRRRRASSAAPQAPVEVLNRTYALIDIVERRRNECAGAVFAIRMQGVAGPEDIAATLGVRTRRRRAASAAPQAPVEVFNLAYALIDVVERRRNECAGPIFAARVQGVACP
jgi:hypothetical protein